VVWAKANFYVDRLTQFPETGSLQETAYLMVYFKKQRADFLWKLTTLQATVNPQDKSVEEYFDQYRQAAFPFIEGGKRQEKKEVGRMMDGFIAQGPLVIDTSKLGDTEWKQKRRRRNPGSGG
jgi:hypothetical protein